MLRSFEYKKRKGDYFVLPNGKVLLNMNGDKDPHITFVLPVITETLDFIQDPDNEYNRFIRGTFWLSRKGSWTFTPGPYNEGKDVVGLITYPNGERPKMLADCQTLNKWTSSVYTHEWYVRRGSDA